jgi:hypothetical protein
MRDGDRRGSDMTATAAVRFLAHDIWDWGDSLARRITVFGWCFSGKGSVGSVVVIEVLEGLEHALHNPN